MRAVFKGLNKVKLSKDHFIPCQIPPCLQVKTVPGYNLLVPLTEFCYVSVTSDRQPVTVELFRWYAGISDCL